MKYKELVLGSFLMFFSLICGSNGNASFGNLTIYNPCTIGSDYVIEYGVCLNGTKIQGPVTNFVNGVCRLLTGKVCAKYCISSLAINSGFSQYPYQLIASTSEAGTCLPGSNRSEQFRQLCFEQYTDSSKRVYRFVYGPFPIVLKEMCLEKGGGFSCTINRWQADFFLFLMETFEQKESPYCDSNKDGYFDCEVNWLLENETSCYCGTPSFDSDGDGVLDCFDYCPSNPTKFHPGKCGCQQNDTDIDNDGVIDCLDECPEDPLKVEPGLCGCGVSEGDLCSNKIAPEKPDPSATTTTLRPTFLPKTPTDSKTTMTTQTIIPITTSLAASPTVTPIIPSPTSEPVPTATIVTSTVIAVIVITVVVFAVVAFLSTNKKRKLSETQDLESIEFKEIPTKKKYVDAVREVLSSQGDSSIFILDRNGSGLIHYSSTLGDLDSTELILSVSRGMREPKLDVVNLRDINKCTPLFLACMNGHSDIAQFLIESGANTSVRDNNGDSLLHVAAKFGHNQIVELLFRMKAEIDLESFNFQGNTALMNACVSGHASVALSLLQIGANVNCVDSNGATPLIAAVRGGHKNMVNSLISYNCLINKPDKFGNHSLHWAALTNNCHAAVVILEWYEKNTTLENNPLNEANMKGETPIFLATREGNSDIVELFLNSNQLKLTDSEIRVLLQTSRSKNFSNVSSVIEKRINGGSPRNSQSKVKKEEIEMYSPGMNHNTDESSPFNNWSESEKRSSDPYSSPSMIKIQFDSPRNSDVSTFDTPKPDSRYCQVIESLLTEHGDSILTKKDNNGMALIHYASLMGDLQSVDFIIRNSTNKTSVVNIQDSSSGSTPMMCACMTTTESSAKIVSLLLCYKANPEVQNLKKQTALHIACQYGSPAYSILLTHEVKTNVKDIEGNTALMEACVSNKIDILRKLLLSGAPIDEQDNQGFTPFLASLKLGHNAICSLLIEHNANLDITDKRGNSALHWAAVTNNYEMLNILFKRGRKVSSKNEVNLSKETPIYLATREGNFEAVEILLCHGADFRIASDSGKCCLDFNNPAITPLFQKYEK